MRHLDSPPACQAPRAPRRTLPDWLGRGGWYLLCCLLILLAGPLAVLAAPASTTPAERPAGVGQTLNIGMLGYRPTAIQRGHWQPLADYLGKALPGYTVRLQILHQAQLEAAVRQKQLDFIFTNPYHFVALRQRNPLSGALATLVRLEGGMPTAQLGGVIISRKARDDLQQFADLAGRQIAAPGINYLGGYMAQAVELAAAGVDLASLQMQFTGQPHDQIIEAVLSGQADAGFIRSSVLEQLEREGGVQSGQLKVIQPRPQPGFPFQVSTRLYPEWPFVALPGVDPQVARRVAAALLLLEPVHPVSQSAGIHGFTVPADYLTVEQAMRELRLPPFDQAPSFTWRDVWARYQTTLIVLLLAITGIATLAWRLALNNRSLSAARAEREAFAAQLEQQRGQLKTLIQTVPDLVWAKDTEGVYLGCNPRFERYFGAREADIVGRTDYDFVSRELADSFRRHDRLAMRKAGSSLNEEWVTYADDGHRELLETTKTPMFDAQGKLLGILGIAHDITQRKQLETSLALRDRYQRALLDNFPFMVWLKDADGRFLAVNQPFVEACGLASADQLVGRTDMDIWPADLAERYVADDRAVIESGAAMTRQELVESAGHRVWMETYKSPIIESGLCFGTVGFARDISLRKRAEDLQRFSAFQAGIAEMSVSVLHNIGNAITVVLENATGLRRASQDLERVAELLRDNADAYAILAADEGLDVHQAGRLLAIQRQAGLTIAELDQRDLQRRSQRILDSVEHISEIVRIQQSAALPADTRSVFDFASLLHDALSMLEDSFKRHAVVVEVELEPALLMLSRNRLLQAMINVLKNAYEAILERRGQNPEPAGRIRVRAGWVDVNRFAIEVEDNGIGFVPEEGRRLFNFGYSTKARGSGFGLHASSLFVQELGGTIRLESAGLGLGAHLRMEFPQVSLAHSGAQ
jgi:PAS domain S-box-containing protein